jgi:hypothetical protein
MAETSLLPAPIKNGQTFVFTPEKATAYRVHIDKKNKMIELIEKGGTWFTFSFQAADPSQDPPQQEYVQFTQDVKFDNTKNMEISIRANSLHKLIKRIDSNHFLPAHMRQAAPGGGAFADAAPGGAYADAAPGGAYADADADADAYAAPAIAAPAPGAPDDYPIPGNNLHVLADAAEYRRQTQKKGGRRSRKRNNKKRRRTKSIKKRRTKRN